MFKIHKIEAISPIVTLPENLKKIALYYFEKNHLSEALSAYEMLSKVDTANSEVWEKIGYCKQQLGNIEGALEAYLRADLIESNNTWVLRRIAQCYRLLKQPNDALQYYKKLERLHPQDLNIQLNIGHCFLELKEYDKALENYFKVEWIDDTNTRVWRSDNAARSSACGRRWVVSATPTTTRWRRASLRASSAN